MLKDFFWSYRQSFRLWMRQRVSPITVEEAEVKQFFWARMYAFSAFGCLVFTTYCTYKSKNNSPLGVGESGEMAGLLTVSDKVPVKVIRMVGFTKVDEKIYSKEEIQRLQKSHKEHINKSE